VHAYNLCANFLFKLRLPNQRFGTENKQQNLKEKTRKELTQCATWFIGQKNGQGKYWYSWSLSG